MEENQDKKSGTVRNVAETAVVAYIAVKVFKGVVATTRDAVCFVQARKANKAAEVKEK
jgi:hypothetical protein